MANIKFKSRLLKLYIRLASHGNDLFVNWPASACSHVVIMEVRHFNFRMQGTLVSIHSKTTQNCISVNKNDLYIYINYIY